MKSKVLTIAGFDPSGGAGILADIKTISSLGSYGIAAITAITYQNTKEVLGYYALSEKNLKSQLEAILSDIEVDAVKTGMLASKENVDTIASILSSYTLSPVVVDPVIASSSGYQLLEDSGIKSLKEKLFPLAEVITPNLMEASRLAGFKVESLDHMKKAAEILFQFGSANVIITGGHLKGEPVDVLFDGREFSLFEERRIEGIEVHGLGCHFSAALATLLSQGLKLKDAVKKAKKIIRNSLQKGMKIGQGRIIPNIFSR